jgi:hypothetical protein
VSQETGETRAGDGRDRNASSWSRGPINTQRILHLVRQVAQGLPVGEPGVLLVLAEVCVGQGDPIALGESRVSLGSELGPGLVELGLNLGRVCDERDLITVLNALNVAPAQAFWNLEAYTGGDGNDG